MILVCSTPLRLRTSTPPPPSDGRKLARNSLLIIFFLLQPDCVSGAPRNESSLFRAARLSPLRGKVGLASYSQGTTGRIGRSTTHYGGLTAGAADQAGQEQLGHLANSHEGLYYPVTIVSANGPGPEWDAECDVGHDRVGTGSKAIRGYVPEVPATLCEGTGRA